MSTRITCQRRFCFLFLQKCMFATDWVSWKAGRLKKRTRQALMPTRWIVEKKKKKQELRSIKTEQGTGAMWTFTYSSCWALLKKNSVRLQIWVWLLLQTDFATILANASLLWPPRQWQRKLEFHVNIKHFYHDGLMEYQHNSGAQSNTHRLLENVPECTCQFQ